MPQCQKCGKQVPRYERYCSICLDDPTPLSNPTRPSTSVGNLPKHRFRAWLSFSVIAGAVVFGAILWRPPRPNTSAPNSVSPASASPVSSASKAAATLPSPPAPSIESKPNNGTKVEQQTRARIAIVEAKRQIAAGQLELAQGTLNDALINLDHDKPWEQVKALHTKVTDDLERRKHANEAPSRVALARELESGMLDEGFDVMLRASGRDKDTLTITYVLINRPFVHNFQRNVGVMSRLKGAGFRRVVLTDGYDQSWQLHLD